MRDTELLAAAIEASGLSARRFAVEVLDVDERTVRRWLAGERELQGTVRLVCRLVLLRPDMATTLAALKN
jgi:DNA-binding transcriptional regulator YiaG